MDNAQFLVIKAQLDAIFKANLTVATLMATKMAAEEEEEIHVVGKAALDSLLSLVEGYEKVVGR